MKKATNTSPNQTLEDYSVDKPSHDATLPPGPPDADDIDFKADKDKTEPGFESVPGAGPNPTK